MPKKTTVTKNVADKVDKRMRLANPTYHFAAEFVEVGG
jgi:hypothetical protein